MEKIISMHQPNYIPWLGYFYKISKANIFVLVDDCQFSTSGMHNYHYIKTQRGLFRLKIPVDYKYATSASINQVKTKDELKWKNYHLKTIMHNYRRTKHFDEIFTDFSNLLLKDYPNLSLMDEAIILFFCKKLWINSDIIRSSSLNITSSREERIIDICKSLGCNVYFSGNGARAYQNEDYFAKHGIRLVYSDFKSFKYSQLWGEFVSNVSILDYLFEYGYDWNRVIEAQKG
jgi:hypothetical protein